MLKVFAKNIETQKIEYIIVGSCKGTHGTPHWLNEKVAFTMSDMLS